MSAPQTSVRTDGSERSRDGWRCPNEEGGREENDVEWWGLGVLLIISRTRVVSQTDLHTRPQGTVGSVCLSPERVGGLSAVHRLPVCVIFNLIPVLLRLYFTFFFFAIIISNLSKTVCITVVERLFALHWRTQLELNSPNREVEVIAPVIVFKGECFISSKIFPFC